MPAIEDYWAGGDPDDVSGYLMDFLNSKFSVDGEPLTDSALDTLIAESPEWVNTVMFNIRNAVRAKTEDE